MRRTCLLLVALFILAACALGARAAGPPEKPPEGTIIIDTEPRGAAVYIDYMFVGLTPVKLNVGAGAHIIQIFKEGYLPYTEQVWVEAGKITKLFVKLKITKGTLYITSIPEGAQVFVDNRFVGITPLNITLPVGTYNVTIIEKGYIPHSEIARVEPGETTNLMIKLEKAEGTLYVDSTPRGAQVFIDNRFVGLTPLKIDLPAGLYNVTLVKEGYLPSMTIARIQPQKATRITIALQKRPNPLIIRLQLAAATIIGAIIGSLATLYLTKRRHATA